MLDTKSMFPDPPAAPATSFVRVLALRDFRIKGETVHAGSVIDVPESLADQLRTANQAELAPGAKLKWVTDEEAVAAKLERRREKMPLLPEKLPLLEPANPRKAR